RVAGILFHAFTSCSNSPTAEAWQLNIRFLPTMPLLLARPSGCCGEAESSNNLGVSAPFAQSTAALVRCDCSAPSASQYTTSVTRPSSLVLIWETVQPVRSSQFPEASARGIIATMVEDLALASQP